MKTAKHNVGDIVYVADLLCDRGTVGRGVILDIEENPHYGHDHIRYTVKIVTPTESCGHHWKTYNWAVQTYETDALHLGIRAADTLYDNSHNTHWQNRQIERFVPAASDRLAYLEGARL